MGLTQVQNYEGLCMKGAYTGATWVAKKKPYVWMVLTGANLSKREGGFHRSHFENVWEAFTGAVL